MKILYDHQIFTSQKYGGISRYFYELIKAFDNIENIETEVPLLISNNHYISDKQFVKHINFFPHFQFKGKQSLIFLVNKPNMIWQLNKQNFDVFHPTYYDPYFLNYIGNKPFVLTVYDMIHEKFKEMFPSKDKTTDYKRILVEKASKIIAISNSTKKDLIEIFGADESKIEVVYLGNSVLFDQQTQLDIEIPNKYILFVGSRSGYKNFDRFLKAVSVFLQKDKELSLICAGGGKFTSAQLMLFESLGIKDQLLQYDLNDDTLSFFYRNAQLFVFPSLYEGFGIPILESFACNCPLICSNTSSFPEIAGNGAKYFDPYNVNSMRETIHHILENGKLRTQLIKNGTERLKEFSWKKTTLETKKIYEKVLS